MLLKIINLLLAIIDLIARHRKKQEQKQHEQQVQQAKKDPADWFDGHFNYGNDQQLQLDDPKLPGNASGPDKTTAAKPEKNN